MCIRDSAIGIQACDGAVIAVAGKAGGADQHELAVRLGNDAVSYTHLRAHETVLDIVCRLLLEKNKTQKLIYSVRSKY